MPSAKNTVETIIKARDAASKKFNKVGKSGMRMGQMLKKAATLAAAYFGVRAIKNFISSSIKLFTIQENAINRLNASLRIVGGFSEAASKDMQKFASSIQNVTTIGDEATLDLMALGASMGGLTDEGLKAATIAAIGFSKSLGMDTKAAMTLVAKAAQGNTATFTKYGIVLDKNMTAQEKFQYILAKGAEGFKIAEAETETFGGKVNSLSNTWGDFKETIGEALTNVLPGLGNMFKFLQVVIENWGLTTDIVGKKFKLGIIGMWEDTKHFFGKVIPDLLLWFGRNWKEIFVQLWEGTKAIFKNMWKNVSDFFSGLWSLLKGEDFDFKWTGLLEGFEFTLSEMPKIAKRYMTATEKSLAKDIDKLESEFGKKLSEKMFPKGPDVKALLAAAAGTEIKTMPKIGGALAGRQGLTAKESRFLTGTGPINKTEQNTGRIVDLIKKTNQILTKNEGKEEKKVLQTVKISNMS